jgi:hypothetical protein
MKYRFCFHEKWSKVEKTTFFDIQIDLQLRFDIKNVLTITKNKAQYTRLGWVNLRKEDFEGLQMTQTTYGIDR